MWLQTGAKGGKASIHRGHCDLFGRPETPREKRMHAYKKTAYMHTCIHAYMWKCGNEHMKTQGSLLRGVACTRVAGRGPAILRGME